MSITDEGEDEIPEFEDRSCPVCGEMISVLKMQHRFLGRYTSPHCGEEVSLPDGPEV